MTTENQVVEEEDPFKASLADREREKKERDRRGQGNYDYSYEDPEYMALEKNFEKAFRILGPPPKYRKEPWHPKYVQQSEVVNDKGTSRIKLNWKIHPDGKLDDSWIFARLYEDVFRSEWQKYSDGRKNDKGHNGEYVRLNAGLKCFQRMDNNLKHKEVKSKMTPSVWPRHRVIFNVLDRMDNWCKENKHSKILTANRSAYDIQNPKPGEPTQIFFTQTGVPNAILEEILDNVVSFSGDWSGIDIVVEALDDKPWYSVRDATEKKIRSESLLAYLQKHGQEKITEEELAYEKYNLDQIYPVASYNKMKKNLGGLFKLVDSELNTTYYEELEELAAEEEKEREKNKPVESKYKDREDGDSEEPAKEDSKPAAAPSASRRRAAEPQEETAAVDAVVSSEESCSKYFPKWSDLDDKEKAAMINSISVFEAGQPKFKDPKSLLGCEDKKCRLPGSQLRTMTPDSLTKCPVCGKVFSLED